MDIGNITSGRKSLSEQHRTRDTSIAALQSQDEETVAHRRNRIWQFIAEQKDGATCWEVEQEFEALHQTISAAISHLSKDGHLVDTGRRRPTGTGRMAIV